MHVVGVTLYSRVMWGVGMGACGLCMPLRCTVVIFPSGHFHGGSETFLFQHNHFTNLKVSRRSVPLSELA